MADRHLVSPRSIYLGPELDAAVKELLAARDVKWTEFARVAIAKAAGRADLAETVEPGRPKKAPAEPKPSKIKSPKRKR